MHSGVTDTLEPSQGWVHSRITTSKLCLRYAEQLLCPMWDMTFIFCALFTEVKWIICDILNADIDTEIEYQKNIYNIIYRYNQYFIFHLFN